MLRNHQTGKHNQKGFTLLEVGLAVALGTIIVISSLYTYSAIRRSQKFDTANMMVQTIRTSIAAQYATSSSYETLLNFSDNQMTIGGKYYSINMGGLMGDCDGSGAIDGTETNLPCDPYKRESKVVAALDGSGGWVYDAATGDFKINLDDAQYGTNGTVEVLPADPSTW